MSAEPLPAAAWFPDPHDPAQLRWWDGAAWTEHQHPVQPGVGSSEPAASASRPHRLELLRDDSAWTLFPHAENSQPHGVAEVAVANQQRTRAMRPWLYASGAVVVLLVVLPDAMLSIGVLLGLTGALCYGLWWVYRGPGTLLTVAVDRWCAARGVRRIGGAVSLGDRTTSLSREDFAAGVAQLRAAGAPVHQRAACQFAGELWGMSGTARITSFTINLEKRTTSYIAVSLALPEELGRFVGVSATFGSDHDQRRDPLTRDLRSWAAVEFESDAKLLGVRVRAHPQQDPLAIWELFDPAYLSDVARRVRATTGSSVAGFVIGDRQVLLWARASMQGAMIEQVQLQRGRPAGAHEGSTVFVDALIAAARDLHRRLIHVWD